MTIPNLNRSSSLWRLGFSERETKTRASFGRNLILPRVKKDDCYLLIQILNVWNFSILLFFACILIGCFIEPVWDPGSPEHWTEDDIGGAVSCTYVHPLHFGDLYILHCSKDDSWYCRELHFLTTVVREEFWCDQPLKPFFNGRSWTMLHKLSRKI